MQVYFPYEKVRGEQNTLIKDIAHCASNGKVLFAQAPTGLGKTASSLAPMLSYALENKKKVFFLTPKISQHEIVLETAQLMNAKFNLGIKALDLVGRKQMCVDPFLSKVGAGFYEACAKAKKEKRCKYYGNTKGYSLKQKQKATRLKRDILEEYNKSFAEIKEGCAFRELCPYEITLEMIKKANLVVADYSHLFEPQIRENILGQGEIKLEDILLIVDEAHNLPERIRDMMTVNLSLDMVEKAGKEARSIGAMEIEMLLKDIGKEIISLGNKLSFGVGEAKLSENEVNFVKKIGGAQIIELEETAQKFMHRHKTENSFLLGMTEVLNELMQEKMHTLYLIERKGSLNITITPLDVADICANVLHNVHSAVLMSGTLVPLEMYADVLGARKKEPTKLHNPEEERVILKEYKSPFPKENRINLFVERTTTKYTSRNEAQFKEIAEIVDGVVAEVPGNTIVFFPSFELMENVKLYLKTKRQTLKQEREMTQQEKTKLVHEFKLLGSRFGGVLLAVSGGSIAEGLDFPGEHLSCAIIAGIPFAKMNPYSNAIIEYNEKKFQKGWDYGYNAPAINKALQAAGRVIRTETDRGVCVFLDQRFSEEKYRKFFPKDFEAKKTLEPEKEVKAFFS
jgi:DNA excision repair protein ERCC-2